MLLLKEINKSYLYIGFLLFCMFPLVSMFADSWPVYMVNFILFTAYGIVVYRSCNSRPLLFTRENLMLTVFLYSSFGVALYQGLSLYIDGDTFVFSKLDAMFYYTESMKMEDLPLVESFKYLYRLIGYDDWGAFIWMSSVFRLINSKLFLNLSYVLLGTISASMLFDIGKRIMSWQYAYICALTYSIASFTLYFHASCLKESVMCFTTIASFHSFYSYLKIKHIRYLITAFLWSSLLLFFRVPIALFMWLTMGTSVILIFFQKQKWIILILFALVIAGLFQSNEMIQYSYMRYAAGGDVDRIAEYAANRSGRGLLFNYFVTGLGTIIGPFPTFNVTLNVVTSLYACGLLYRLLLAMPFWAGCIYAVKNKVVAVYPLLIFSIVEMFSLALITQGLELRKNMPHIFCVYLAAFWFLNKYDHIAVKRNNNNHKWIIYGWFAIVGIICIYWNFRVR